MSVPRFPAYSPDLNPIEQAIAKLKAHLRKLAPRSPQSLTAALRDGLQQFAHEVGRKRWNRRVRKATHPEGKAAGNLAECAAFLRHAGYGQSKRKRG